MFTQPIDHDLLNAIHSAPESPAFVYSESDLRQSASALRTIADTAGATLLYSIKSCELSGVLETVQPYVNGFGTSSLFESRLARQVLGDAGTVHLFASAISPEEIDELVALSDYVSLNSLGQLARYGPAIHGNAKCGLRVNPGRSFVADNRYDPSRRHSKLGVTLDRVLSAAEEKELSEVDGLHLHTNCDSTDLNELLATVRHTADQLGGVLERMEWINLGGGYLFEDSVTLDPFYEAVSLLRSKYGLQVFVEPGAALVRKAGYLLATVLDIFDSDGKTIAVLDTTVNHMPEVFEYQYSPDVIRHSADGRHRYILAGRSCLAGDLFGEYAFDEPLETGSRVLFANMGAYTLVKAHMFNGINLPAVYALTEDGSLVLKKRFTYDDFLSRSGADTRVFA